MHVCVFFFLQMSVSLCLHSPSQTFCSIAHTSEKCVCVFIIYFLKLCCIIVCTCMFRHPPHFCFNISQQCYHWWMVVYGGRIKFGHINIKHAIAAYGTDIAGLPSQIFNGGWQKICHAIPPRQPWCRHLTTMFKRIVLPSGIGIKI